MMQAEAYAKVNLSLMVFARMADGFHPIRGMFQSISLADGVSIAAHDRDAIETSNDEAPEDETNLAWRAFDAVRRVARVTQPSKISITKRIPAGAGLGGGSADAAAVLGLASDRFGVDADSVMEIAESIGSDVPFSVVGGTALVEGRGERITPAEALSGFAFAIAVPPVVLATPEVYAKWDELDGPTGEAVAPDLLPPALRDGPPIRNDLFPAALALDERIGDWLDELRNLWGVPVMMTGSGSALFGLFPTEDEAASAAAAVSLPTRLAAGATPVDVGWRPVDG